MSRNFGGVATSYGKSPSERLSERLLGFGNDLAVHKYLEGYSAVCLCFRRFKNETLVVEMVRKVYSFVVHFTCIHFSLSHASPQTARHH